MEKCVFSSSRSNSLRGNCTVCCELMSSITGKSAAGSVDKAEAAATGLDHDFLAFDAQGNRNLLRQRPQNIQKFTAWHGDVAAVLHGDFRGCDEFHFKIRGRDRQLSLAHTQQHIGQYRHGLAAFDHPDNRLQWGQ